MLSVRRCIMTWTTRWKNSNFTSTDWEWQEASCYVRSSIKILTIVSDVLKLVDNLTVHWIVTFPNLPHANVVLVMKQTYNSLTRGHINEYSFISPLHTHTCIQPFCGRFYGTTWVSRRTLKACMVHSPVDKRRSLAGVLLLSCARPVVDGWPLMWVNHPL